MAPAPRQTDCTEIPTTIASRAISWLRKYLGNILLLFGGVIVALAIGEVAANYWVRYRQQLLLPYKMAEERYEAPDIVSFREKYGGRVKLRGPSVFEKNKDASASELLYSVYRAFNSTNRDNILIQGDSWADYAVVAKPFLVKFAEQAKVGLINGGVSSSAPTPITIQLDFLRSEFDIHPTIVLAIIDQTDIGDELFRYKNRVFDASGRLIAWEGTDWTDKLVLFRSKRRDNLFSNRSAIGKLINHISIDLEERHAVLSLYSEPLGTDILSPLIEGPSRQTEDLFVETLHRYIGVVFEDTNVKKLIFVSHPHKGHLLPETDRRRFKGEVGRLIERAIGESFARSKILHMDFLTTERTELEKAGSMEVFQSDDRFSHLTEEKYATYFYPAIASYLAKAALSE